MKRLRILLVDDHRDTLHVMEKLLGRKHAVSSAATFADAIALVTRHQFDLAIMDMRLPDGNGLDLMRQIRQVHPIPGIALSGLAKEADIQNSKDAGFCVHLAKPVSIEDLEAAIIDCLETPPANAVLSH